MKPKKNVSKKSDRHIRKNSSIFSADRWSSEPNLTDISPHSSRWHTFPHEYISVDELHFHRRKKKPPEASNETSLPRNNQSEQSLLPFSVLKTEYVRSYTEPQLTKRPDLRRRPTSLKLHGLLNASSEYMQQFILYTAEDIAKSRPLAAAKLPANLVLDGDQLFLPEYRSAFVRYKPDNAMSLRQAAGKPSTASNGTMTATKSHLKLEGDVVYEPEYRREYVHFPVSKSKTVSQIDSIKFPDNFVNVPEPEYRNKFKQYDNFVKSAPFKKPDTIKLIGAQETGEAEYRARFQEPDLTNFTRTVSLKKQDNLQMKGDFARKQPEYSDNFTNPKLTQAPPRAKPRKSSIALQGDAEFEPEYKSTFLDHPRSRSIARRPDASLKLTTETRHIPKPKKYQKRLERSLSPVNVHQIPLPTDDLPFELRPEYRKAKAEFLIRERLPPSRQIAQDVTVTTVTKPPVDFKDQQRQLPAASPRRTLTSRRASVVKNHIGQPISSISPRFKLTVENVDDLGGTFKKQSPKFGRRVSVASQNVRNRTNVIEGNPKYATDRNKNIVPPTKSNSSQRGCDNDPAFIVLKEQCRPNVWMKPSWYDT